MKGFVHENGLFGARANETSKFLLIAMFYAILGIIVIVALFLIFRDDHDDSYNKSEKPRPMAQPIKAQIIEEVQAAVTEAKKDWNLPEAKQVDDEEFPDDDEELDLSFLDNIDYSEDLEENTETFDITGLRYHCTVHDCGKIVGIVKPEPSNVHDPRAQAVYRNDGKLLGYIPRTQQDWYEDFNEENVPCPFVGEIELDRSSARLIAEIKVIIPSSREYVEEEIKDEL